MMTKPHTFLEPICESSVSCHAEGSAGHRLEWSLLVKSRGVVGLADRGEGRRGCLASGVSKIQPNVRTNFVALFQTIGYTVCYQFSLFREHPSAKAFHGADADGFKKERLKPSCTPNDEQQT